jgi:hypothetical protein
LTLHTVYPAGCDLISDASKAKDAVDAHYLVRDHHCGEISIKTDTLAEEHMGSDMTAHTPVVSPNIDLAGDGMLSERANKFCGDSDLFIASIDGHDSLEAMHISAFLAAHSKESSGRDNALIIAMSYEKWNQWEMKAVCGTEVLQDINWDDLKTRLAERKDGKRGVRRTGLCWQFSNFMGVPCHFHNVELLQGKKKVITTRKSKRKRLCAFHGLRVIHFMRVIDGDVSWNAL